VYSSCFELFLNDTLIFDLPFAPLKSHSLLLSCGMKYATYVDIRVSRTKRWLKWYPAPNLGRALAPSWVGRFCCLTQELVTRLNFGSASAQAAPPLLHLLTFLLTFCPVLLSLTSPRRGPTSEPLVVVVGGGSEAREIMKNYLARLFISKNTAKCE
jgi:hypothetical protein